MTAQTATHPTDGTTPLNHSPTHTGACTPPHPTSVRRKADFPITITCGKISTRNRARLITYSCAIKPCKKSKEWGVALDLLHHMQENEKRQQETSRLLEEMK